MDRERKRKTAHEVLIFLLTLALITLIIRMWPILFLIILGLLGCALRLLFLSSVKVEVIEPLTVYEPPARPDTEQDVVLRAYGVLQRRITEEITVQFPAARWVWASPNALVSITNDEPVFILLNNAGGYRKAMVKIHNLQYRGLQFQTMSDPDQNNDSDGLLDDCEPEDYLPEDHEKAVSDWTDAHLLSLNERGNEAVGKGMFTFLIPTDELPDRINWHNICRELLANGFTSAEVQNDGITVTLPTTERKESF